MRSLRTLFCLGLLVPTAAMGGDLPTRSDQCVGLMTIQKRGCEVETVYRCPGDDGEVYRSESYDGDGFGDVTLSDLNYNLVVFSDRDGEFQMFGERPETWSTHPDEVVRTGKGEFHQVGRIKLFGIEKPARLDGELVLEPQSVEINGVAFRHFTTSARMQLPYPMPLIEGTGNTYHDPVSGVMFEGATELDLFSEGEVEIPTSPAQIILPGESGFGTTLPTYDCDQISSLDSPVDQETRA